MKSLKKIIFSGALWFSIAAIIFSSFPVSPLKAADVIGGGSSGGGDGGGGGNGGGDDRILFGGKILHVQYCNDGILFYVGPPRPGVFKTVPSSLIFAWWVIVPGVWTLGYGRGGVAPCMLGPYITGFGFPVVMMGTSLPGGGGDENGGGSESSGGGESGGGSARPSENTQMP